MHGGTVTYTTNVLRKIGFGTMWLNGAYTVPGTVKIEGGAIKLGASNLWGDSSYRTPIVLCGGTIATAANTSNDLGIVTLTANSGISLESGATLTCTNLSSVAWKEGTTLSVTIPKDSHGELLGSLRFGTSADALTKAQINQIRLNGKRVALDSSGYLRHLGTKIVVR